MLYKSEHDEYDYHFNGPPMSIDPEQLRRLQELRIPKEKEPYKGIAKVSAKKKAKIQDEKALQEMDKAFYTAIWMERPHTCENCGCSLGRYPNNIFFHHLLLKSIYPHLRHVKENIMLLCLKCHSQEHTMPGKMEIVNYRVRKAEKELL